MSEAGLVALLVAAITGIPGVAAAVLANRGRQHARAARVQVENNHDTNLREEGDERHHENTRLLNLAIQLIMGAKKDIRGMRYDIGRIYNRLDAQQSAIDDLEDTQEGRKK